MKKTANLQDIFLTKARKQGVPLSPIDLHEADETGEE